jgi:hypothetical protein
MTITLFQSTKSTIIDFSYPVSQSHRLFSLSQNGFDFVFFVPPRFARPLYTLSFGISLS